VSTASSADDGHLAFDLAYVAPDDCVQALQQAQVGVGGYTSPKGLLDGVLRLVH